MGTLHPFRPARRTERVEATGTLTGWDGYFSEG
jgi:hypothetical protein